MTSDRIIEALLAERKGYERRGLTDRVAEVDAMLARLGVFTETETATAQPQVETAARKKPLRRKKG